MLDNLVSMKNLWKKYLETKRETNITLLVLTVRLRLWFRKVYRIKIVVFPGLGDQYVGVSLSTTQLIASTCPLSRKHSTTGFKAHHFFTTATFIVPRRHRYKKKNSPVPFIYLFYLATIFSKGLA